MLDRVALDPELKVEAPQEPRPAKAGREAPHRSGSCLQCRTASGGPATEILSPLIFLPVAGTVTVTPTSLRDVKGQGHASDFRLRPRLSRKRTIQLEEDGTVCGPPGYQVFVGSVFGPPNRPMVGYSQYPRYHSTPKAKATSRVV